MGLFQFATNVGMMNDAICLIGCCDPSPITGRADGGGLTPWPARSAFHSCRADNQRLCSLGQTTVLPA